MIFSILLLIAVLVGFLYKNKKTLPPKKEVLPLPIEAEKVVEEEVGEPSPTVHIPTAKWVTVTLSRLHNDLPMVFPRSNMQIRARADAIYQRMFQIQTREQAEACFLTFIREEMSEGVPAEARVFIEIDAGFPPVFKRYIEV